MKKFLIVLALSNASMAQEMSTTVREPKPMIEGNRRADEIIAWSKLHPGTMPPLTEEEKYHYFTKDGIPVPGSGAQVRPMHNIKMNHEQSAAIHTYVSSQNKQGYVDKFSHEAKMLFEIPAMAESDFEKHQLMTLSNQDTHMRANAYDLKMNYEYAGIPAKLVKRVIGFSPEHTYVENGWNGATEFFVPYFYDSVCAFHEINIGLTGSAAIIPKEIVSYNINNKTTIIATEGNTESGFIYKVEWWDEEYRRSLDCAVKNYSIDTQNEVIGLARIIDTSRN